MLISGIHLVVSCSGSVSVLGDKPPADFKSCTRILARRERERGSFGVKTELNCSLNRLALVLVSEWSLFSCFRGGVPCWSRREFFRYLIKFTVLHDTIRRCAYAGRICANQQN